MPHAMRIHEAGGPENLKWEEVEVGAPGPGQVRVRNTAIGLNFVDTYQRSGLYPMPMPFTLGSEGIIPGFQIGVNGMREGGERRISIPPELGYGAQDVTDAEGNVIVPGNSTLIFDIRLVAVGASADVDVSDSTKA